MVSQSQSQSQSRIAAAPPSQQVLLPVLSLQPLLAGNAARQKAARRRPAQFIVLALHLAITSVGADQARELPALAFPIEGAGGPDTYLPNVTLVSCGLLNPYPAAVSQPWNPTIIQAKAFCSARVQCGGIVYRTAAANLANGDANLATAFYCLPQAFVFGTVSSTSGVAYVRHTYNSCDVRISLTSNAQTHYGTLSDVRNACVQPGRGLTSSRDRTPRPQARKYKVPPKPLIKLSGHYYEVGKEVFVDGASAQNKSADGSFHVMISSAGVYYYMPGASHANREQAEKPFDRDGWYPLYSSEVAAKAADTRGGGNGQAHAVGPTSALGQPIKWISAPHVQTHWMASGSERLFYGDYVAPFALDGYYPLYRNETDAKKASTNYIAQSHGPNPSPLHGLPHSTNYVEHTGHPLTWTTGEIRLYYMPVAGVTQYYGTYEEKQWVTNLERKHEKDSLADAPLYSHSHALPLRSTDGSLWTHGPRSRGVNYASLSAATVSAAEAMPTNTAEAEATLSAAPASDRFPMHTTR